MAIRASRLTLAICVLSACEQRAAATADRGAPAKPRGDTTALVAADDRYGEGIAHIGSTLIPLVSHEIPGYFRRPPCPALLDLSSVGGEWR